MCTGSSARVRRVTAAAAACGSRFSVTGSMSAKTGRARSYTGAFAEATNENGLVTTSSPSSTPTARSGVCPRCARRLHAVLERVDERIPRGRDEVLRDADRAPHLVSVRGVDEHACDRVGALGLVEDPDLEVDQLDVAKMRVDLADRVAQRVVESVHRAVPLGGAHVALAAEPDLDRRLRHHLAVRALFD